MVAGMGVVMSAGAWATHVPTSLDVDRLYDNPDPKYLEFINPREHPNLIGVSVPASPPGAIQTEEYTGYTLPNGVDIIERGDSDTTAGDRADFDWVQENRACETGGPCNNPLPVNHPNLVGAMGWTIDTPDVSPHVDPGTGLAHNHSDEETPPGALPHLELPGFTGDSLLFVDVFSIISEGQDEDVDVTGALSRREAALDYDVAFGNSVTGASTIGVPVIVWVPGWTLATGIDDFVARWAPLTPGAYDLVAIEPAAGSGHDERTEIDALATVPEPAALALLGLGLAAFGARRRMGGVA